jgi:hypothetical protein
MQSSFINAHLLLLDNFKKLQRKVTEAELGASH